MEIDKGTQNVHCCPGYQLPLWEPYGMCFRILCSVYRWCHLSTCSPVPLVKGYPMGVLTLSCFFRFALVRTLESWFSLTFWIGLHRAAPGQKTGGKQCRQGVALTSMHRRLPQQLLELKGGLRGRKGTCFWHSEFPSSSISLLVATISFSLKASGIPRICSIQSWGLSLTWFHLKVTYLSHSS